MSCSQAWRAIAIGELDLRSRLGDFSTSESTSPRCWSRAASAVLSALVERWEWLAKEKVRDVYLTDDPDLAATRLDDAIAFTKHSMVPEAKTLNKSLTRWRTAILAHHATGASNGPTEAVNLTIKAVKRCGRGFRNFANYRLRLLLVAGVTWQTQPVTRLRSRPRLIA